MRGFDAVAYTNGWRPFRAPRVVRSYLDPELLCMEWQQGQALYQLTVIELPAALINESGARR